MPVLAKQICSNIDNLNKQIQNSTQFQSQLLERISDTQTFAFINNWHQSREPNHCFELICAGLDIKQPQYRFEKNRFVMSF